MGNTPRHGGAFLAGTIFGCVEEFVVFRTILEYVACNAHIVQTVFLEFIHPALAVVADSIETGTALVGTKGCTGHAVQAHAMAQHIYKLLHDIQLRHLAYVKGNIFLEDGDVETTAVETDEKGIFLKPLGKAGEFGLLVDFELPIQVIKHTENRNSKLVKIFPATHITEGFLRLDVEDHDVFAHGGGTNTDYWICKSIKPSPVVSRQSPEKITDHRRQATVLWRLVTSCLKSRICYDSLMLDANTIRRNILFVAMGFVAMVAQIVVMRRLIIVFGGNELVSGAVLAGWLGFSGIGNLIAGRFADRLEDIERSVAISFIILAFIVPLTIAASMLVKVILGIPPPVIVGLTSVVVPILAILAPLGVAIGISFTLACRLPQKEGAAGIGRVYMLDTLGAAAGGVIFSLVAIVYLSAMQAGIIAAAVLITALGLAFDRRSIKVASLGLTIMLAILLCFSQSIESKLISLQWRGYNTAVQKETRFANLMITDNRGERTMFVDGRPSFSLPLPETYETIANLPLIEHGDPKDVAIVGGGISGVLSQWKKWKLESAFFIRLDPEETVLERFSMPSDLAELPPWARILQADARRLFRDGLPGGCTENCLDVIIIDVGDPDTASADRYFTSQFFEEVKRMLRPDGILMIGLLEPANAIAQEAKKVLGTVRRSLGDVFAHTIIVPLDRFYFISSEASNQVTNDTAELIRRLRAQGMGESFLVTRVLAGIYPERVAGFSEEIEEAALTAPVNTDTRPFAYLAGMLLWERRAGGRGADFLRAGTKLRPWMGVLILATLVALSIVFGRKSPERVRSTFILSATGLAAITYEIVLLVHYQMVEGILVWRIGLILTAFMVGAGLGAGIVTRIIRKGALNRVLIISLILMAIYIPFQFSVCRLSFILANFIIGLFGGWIYQLVALGLVSESRGVGKTAGIVESSDHWGSAAGALLASVLIVPLFGLMSALIVADATIVAAIVVALTLRKKAES